MFGPGMTGGPLDAAWLLAAAFTVWSVALPVLGYRFGRRGRAAG